MRPGQTEVNELEMAILRRIAVDHHPVPWLPENLHVLAREYTGVGCFTSFLMSEVVARTEIAYIGLKATVAMPGVPNGLGAVLFTKGSQPDCLEIYTFGNDRWDGTYEGFSIA